jgi:hypothetical protein
VGCEPDFCEGSLGSQSVGRERKYLFGEDDVRIEHCDKRRAKECQVRDSWNSEIQNLFVVKGRGRGNADVVVVGTLFVSVPAPSTQKTTRSVKIEIARVRPIN